VGEVQVAPSIKLETGILKSSVMGDPTDATTVDVLVVFGRYSSDCTSEA
jgi:hypothetical protein